MSFNTDIQTALRTVCADVQPNLYTGKATEFITYNYSEYGVLHGDDTANAVRYAVQVHYFLPNAQNPNLKKKAIKRALNNMGCTYPNCINASDGDGQHYVFECYYADGDV